MENQVDKSNAKVAQVRGSSSRVVLGAAKWRENKRKSKDPGFAPRLGQT